MLTKITDREKNNLFWYLLVPVLVWLTLFISLSPWFFELLATPPDRVFTGINRWSTDYYLYLSYVEQGKQGLLPVKILLTTMPHLALLSHLSYTIPGYLFGHILGLNSIAIYHLFRSFYGLIFLITCVLFFYKISKSKIITIVAFILSFYVSGFVKISSLIPFQATRYLSWLQEQNIIGRSTGPLHYNTGFVVFIIGFLYYFYTKNAGLKKIIIFGILLNLLLLTNPFNYQLMLFCFAGYLIIRFVFYPKNKAFGHEILTIISSFCLSLPIFSYLYLALSTEPWGTTGVSPKFYAVTTPPIGFWEAALSIGPIFFLGIIGIIISIIGKRTIVYGGSKIDIENRRSRIEQDQSSILYSQNLSSIIYPPSLIYIFLILWPSIQFFLLLFGNQLKIHPPRAFSGLYFLPLAYFSAQLIIFISKKFSQVIKISFQQLVIIITIFLFAITLPNYWLSYQEHLYAFTDFTAFSLFSFPTKKQVEAFRFLEKNTPPTSGVLAMFEANSLIMGFSANATELGLPYQTQSAFFANKMKEKEALTFLKKNHFQYVYFGYQEQAAGGNMDSYPFLTKVFENAQVKIYHVNQK